MTAREEGEVSRGTSRRRTVAQDQAAGRKGALVKKEMEAARARILAEEADQTFEGVVRYWLREAADHYFEAGGEDRCREEMLAGLRVLPVAIRMEAMGMAEVEVDFPYEQIATVGADGKVIDTWPPGVEENRPLPLYADLTGHTFIEHQPFVEDPEQ